MTKKLGIHTRKQSHTRMTTKQSELSWTSLKKKRQNKEYLIKRTKLQNTDQKEWRIGERGI